MRLAWFGSIILTNFATICDDQIPLFNPRTLASRKSMPCPAAVAVAATAIFRVSSWIAAVVCGLTWPVLGGIVASNDGETFFVAGDTKIVFATVAMAVPLILLNPMIASVIGFVVSTVLETATQEGTLFVEVLFRVVDVLVHAHLLLHGLILLVVMLRIHPSGCLITHEMSDFPELFSFCERRWCLVFGGERKCIKSAHFRWATMIF